jgi:hypothetical protein
MEARQNFHGGEWGDVLMGAGVEGEYPIYIYMGHLKLEEVNNSAIDEG